MKQRKIRLLVYVMILSMLGVWLKPMGVFADSYKGIPEYWAIGSQKEKSDEFNKMDSLTLTLTFYDTDGVTRLDEVITYAVSSFVLGSRGLPDKAGFTLKWEVTARTDIPMTGGDVIQAMSLKAVYVPIPDLTMPKVTTPSCAHSFEWEVQSEATETSDGTMANVCTKCGMVTEYMQGGSGATSAYAVFNSKLIDRIAQTPSGGTLTIDTNLWTSFTQALMEAIAGRRDITIELTYRLAGKEWKIVIPAGAEVPADVPYAGFDGYLAGLYGKSEIVK